MERAPIFHHQTLVITFFPGILALRLKFHSNYHDYCVRFLLPHS